MVLLLNTFFITWYHFWTAPTQLVINFLLYWKLNLFNLSRSLESTSMEMVFHGSKWLQQAKQLGLFPSIFLKTSAEPRFFWLKKTKTTWISVGLLLDSVLPFQLLTKENWTQKSTLLFLKLTWSKSNQPKEEQKLWGRDCGVSRPKAGYAGKYEPRLRNLCSKWNHYTRKFLL